MNRKIAAIFAADVAGYSKLVAEDEEETLRRLASYRAVMDDFIARAGGRIFNTAGDAVLAEFPSAVEAVRCAIDIQESLRTRNMAYPASRQMSFRIGITIGDVVERNGDLLGDGVNIAARLEGIAPVGGICISRTVYEQVANKLSVQFADIGEQQVKNIPTPVHAYKFEMRPDDGRFVAAPVKKPAKTAPASWIVPVAIAAPVAAIAIAALAYLMGERHNVLSPSPPSPSPTTTARTMPLDPQPQAGATTASGASAGEPMPSSAPTSPGTRQAEALVPETIPFLTDRQRNNVRNEYMPAADHKALAISSGPIGFTSAQADDETAKTGALDICQKRADALPQQRKCEIYAVGNTVVYAGTRPPMPPPPWVKHDPATTRPLVAGDIPLIRQQAKASIEKNYLNGRVPKALALGPFGGFSFVSNQESADEAVRRALEICGNNAGVPCITIAVNEDFVVPIPTTMKVAGFFQPISAAAIAPELRDDVVRRLANGSGWTAVATGAGGHAGVMLGAANEQDAIAGAMADCAKHDSACRVIGIGPFAVEPN
jgi:class 3 adenylate cyclase